MTEKKKTKCKRRQGLCWCWFKEKKCPYFDETICPYYIKEVLP